MSSITRNIKLSVIFLFSVLLVLYDKAYGASGALSDKNTSVKQLICEVAHGIVITLGLDWHEWLLPATKQEWEPPKWNNLSARNALFRTPHRKKPTMG